MKKISKILAALLAVVLLVGFASTVISADASSGARSSGIISDSAANNNFEEGKAFTITVNEKDTGEITSELINTGNNTYNRFEFNSVGADGASLNTLDQIGLPSFYISNLLSYDYLTIDFDIVADKYTDGKNLITINQYNALTDAEKEAYYPSYVESWLYWEFKQIASDYSKKTLSISMIDGAWYLISNDGDKANKYPLPMEAGAWTHITQVIEISNTATFIDGDSTATSSFRDFVARVNAKTISPDALVSVNLSESKHHIYVDGEYAFEIKDWVAADKDNTDYATFTDGNCNDAGKAFAIKYGRIRGGHDSSTKITKSFSIGLDNMRVRTYANYTGDLHNAVKSRDALFSCGDTHFNAFYEYPEGTPYRAKLTTEDKVETYYYLPAAAISSATYNSEIELLTNCIAPIKPKTQFAVKHNGYSISVDPASGYILSEHADEDKYSVRRALYSDYADVVWDYEGELYDVTRSLSGSVPVYLGDTSIVNGIKPGNKFCLFKGWSTNPDATEPEELPVLSAGDELYLYPVCDIFDIAYLILASDGSLVQVNGSYDCYKDINTIGTAISSAPSGSKVTLLSDVDMAKTAPIVISKAASIEIDLNGFTMYYELVGATSTSYMATLSSAGAKLSIYSSKPGAKIISTSVNANGSATDVARLFNVTAAASVVLGNGEDDLVVNANALFVGNVTSGKASLVINGGTYVSDANSNAGLVSLTGSANFELTVNDALLAAKNILFKDEGNVSITATINNSTVIRTSSSPIGYIIGTKNMTSTYTINNSTIIGKLLYVGEGGMGNIVLGAGTKLTDDLSISKGYSIVVQDGAEQNSVSEAITVNYTSYDYSYAGGKVNATEATRTVSSTVKVAITASETPVIPEGGDVNAEVPENGADAPDEDTPVIPTGKSIVYATKTLNVHDAPVSITLGATDANNSTECDILPILNLANVEAIPTKEENE